MFPYRTKIFVGEVTLNNRVCFETQQFYLLYRERKKQVSKKTKKERFSISFLDLKKLIDEVLNFKFSWRRNYKSCFFLISEINF